MEGVALESIALAGHLQLDNLVLIYDNNQVTCDGPLSWINTEDVNAKMRACGWAVIEISDGTNDVDTIVAALQSAQLGRSGYTLRCWHSHLPPMVEPIGEDPWRQARRLVSISCRSELNYCNAVFR